MEKNTTYNILKKEKPRMVQKFNNGDDGESSADEINDVSASYLANPYSVPQDNKFDKTKVFSGHFVNSNDGVINENAAYSVQEFIPVFPDKEYITNPAINQNFAFYTSAKVYISGFGSLINADGSFRTPINGAFISMSSVTSIINQQYLYLVAIEDGSITLDKVAFPVVEGIRSKNLFNKNSPDIKKGFYCEYGSGTQAAQSQYFNLLMAVEPNTVYTPTVNGVRSTEQIAFFKKDSKYAGGLIQSGTFTTPADVYWIRLNEKLVNLDSMQLVKGGEVLPYQKYDVLIDADKIVNGVKFEASKNLFDKESTLISLGQYYDYESGSLQNNADYFCTKVSVKPSTKYTVSRDGAKSTEQIAFWNAAGESVRGLVNAATFTTPSNVVMVGLNEKKTFMDTFMLTEGENTLSYIQGGMMINSSRITKPNGIAVVARTGGDFTSLQKAVNSLVSTAENPTTIIVYPGIYEGMLQVQGKNLRIVGINKKDCIITTKTGNYIAPPIECAGNFYCANMSIIATSEKPDVHSINSYGVHFDFAGPGLTEFFNCYVESQQNSAFGIGTHQDQTLVINSCELVKNSEGANYNGGGLFMHNSTGADTGQKLIVKNSSIVTDLGIALAIDDARMSAGGIDVDTTLTFINNMLYSDELGLNCVAFRNAPTAGGISGRIKLTPYSFGNNIAALNK